MRSPVRSLTCCLLYLLSHGVVCGVRRDLFRRLCCESDDEEELACVITARNKSLCYKKKTNTPTQEQASQPILTYPHVW